MHLTRAVLLATSMTFFMTQRFSLLSDAGKEPSSEPQEASRDRRSDKKLRHRACNAQSKQKAAPHIGFKLGYRPSSARAKCRGTSSTAWRQKENAKLPVEHPVFAALFKYMWA